MTIEIAKDLKNFDGVMVFFFLFLFSFVSTSQPFLLTYGGSNKDYGYAIQETQDGGFIVTGKTKSFGDGFSDLLLSKFNENGSHIWTTTLGGSLNDLGRSVQETQDGGFIVTGRTESFGAGSYDVLLSKFNAIGIPIWTTTLGGDGDDRGRSVQETVDGGFIVTGYTYYLSWNVLLAKFYSDGSHIWTSTLGGVYDDYGKSVQETQDGGFIVAGERNYYDYGDVIVNVLLCKFDAFGSHTWTTTLSGTSEDCDDGAFSVQETFDGGYIVAGYSDYRNVLLSKFSSDGSHTWTKAFGGISQDRGYSVQQTQDGGYIVAGKTESYGAAVSDVFLSKFESDGNIEWMVTLFGTSGYEQSRGYSVQETQDGGFVVGGYTNGFGAELGNNDILLSKFYNDEDIDCGQWLEVTPTVVTELDVIIDNPVLSFDTPTFSENKVSPVINRWYPGLKYECVTCFDVLIDGSESGVACSGNGECEGPNYCVCSEGYDGLECSENAGGCVVYVSLVVLFLSLLFSSVVF